MESNFDEETDERQKQGLLRTLAIKIGIKKPKELKSQMEEINHLKFQVMMMEKFRHRNVK